jgi:hypothetical protein
MACAVKWCFSQKQNMHGFITNTNSNLIGTKNRSKSELGVYLSPPVRIAQLLFGGPAGRYSLESMPELVGSGCHR